MRSAYYKDLRTPEEIMKSKQKGHLKYLYGIGIIFDNVSSYIKGIFNDEQEYDEAICIACDHIDNEEEVPKDIAEKLLQVKKRIDDDSKVLGN